MNDRLGFIGLGTMGAQIARRLLECGIRLAVFDIDKDRSVQFTDIPGCHRAVSAQEVAAAGRVITMLPDSRAVSEVLFGAGALARSLSAGSLVIDMSTGSVPAFLKQAEMLASMQVQMVDIPVGRSPAEARTGQLIAMAGMDRNSSYPVADILSAIAEETVYAGALGNGLRLKLVNNYMAMVGHVLAGEVLALAKAAGLDRKQTVSLLQKTAAGRGQLLTNYPKKVLAGDITPDFPVSMGIKDIDMALELFSAGNLEGRFGTLARQIFTEAVASGYGDRDCTAVMLHLDETFKSR